ncbi:MAG: phosphatidylglycerol lysyltransferase domain-containing protein, partial [Nitrospirales bacterium]
MSFVFSSMKNWKYVGVGLSLFLFGGALIALHHILVEVHLKDVLAHFHDISWRALILSSFCVGGSYFALTGYDVLALRHLGRSLPYSLTGPASFISYTFSHNIGLSLITGGSIRYRIYSPAGLSAVEIATLTGLCAMTFGLGVSLMLGLALVVEPDRLTRTDGISPLLNRVMGLCILLGVSVYLIWTAIQTQPLQLKSWTMTLPTFQITLQQLALGAVDITLAAAALFLVLPPNVEISFPAFIGIYVCAMTIGVLSHAPGGLGVFEALMLLALSHVEPGALFGSLLVYRCLYYFAPFAVAACLLVWHERQWGTRVLTPAVQMFQRVGRATTPPILGSAIFASGVILLFSSATPIVGGRLNMLRPYLPLPFIEVSHLLSSVVGLWLMFLARGVFRRMETAFHMAQWMLCGGILFSLVKGFDYEEAGILGVILVVLRASQGAFYRKGSLTWQFSAAWLGTIVIGVAGSMWLAMFAFKHVNYSHDLWGEFAYGSDVSRTLRSTMAVTILLIGFLVLECIRRVHPKESAKPTNIFTVRTIVGRSLRTEANLALLGDKRFLMSGEEDAFVMYQIHGRSWVSMGDPVGPERSWEPLLWQYRSLCDQYDGWP